MKPAEKHRLIKAYAVDLTELAHVYALAASVVEKLPAHVVDGLYQVRVQGNEQHDAIARAMQDIVDAAGG